MPTPELPVPQLFMPEFEVPELPRPELLQPELFVPEFGEQVCCGARGWITAAAGEAEEAVFGGCGRRMSCGFGGLWMFVGVGDGFWRLFVPRSVSVDDGSEEAIGPGGFFDIGDARTPIPSPIPIAAAAVKPVENFISLPFLFPFPLLLMMIPWMLDFFSLVSLSHVSLKCFQTLKPVVKILTRSSRPSK